jgi:hypothetical protein
MRNTYCFCFFLFVLCSCAGVRKSELDAIAKFATATHGISQTPTDLYLRVNRIKSESELLQKSTLIAQNDRIDYTMDILRQHFDNQVRVISTAEQSSNAYKVLERYAQLLLLLSAPDYLKEFIVEKEAWQKSFDSLLVTYDKVAATPLPLSLGKFCGELVGVCGKKRLQYLQRRFLKSAIQNGTVPITEISTLYTSGQGRALGNEIEDLETYVTTNFRDFLENVKLYEDSTGINPYNYYNQYLPIYIGWLHQIREMKAVHAETMKAFTTLGPAIVKVQETFRKKDQLPQLAAQCKLLYFDYLSIAGTYRKFEEERKALARTPKL